MFYYKDMQIIKCPECHCYNILKIGIHGSYGFKFKCEKCGNEFYEKLFIHNK